MSLSSSTFSDTFEIPPQLARSLMVASFHQALETISVSRDLLLTTPLLNAQVTHIKPIVCDRATQALRKIDESVGRLMTLVGSLTSLQTSVFFNRHSLLMHLYRAHEGASNLLDQLTDFRSICLSSSSEKQQEQRSIQQRLADLVVLYGVIEKGINAILDSLLISD